MAESVEYGGHRRWSRLRIAAWSAAVLLLLLPLFAMQVTDEVAWTPFDFVFAGVLLGGVGLALEVAVRKMGSNAYRAAAAVALLGALMLVWVNGAVGIIGSEENDANLLYAAVLAIGLTGAVIARFRPEGMARALSATALAQVLVGVLALAAGLGSDGASWPRDVLGLTVFFAALWLVSAWLFQRAARERTAARATS